ncbi:vacuolar protein sorting-associated protein 11 homolog [Zeugodacus cucurbitae]|uniref:vacuolar protein sorting-associated protein 11 homolog n=1 Tax=Zeugodacus cucurbitae TaxID=28588 RepID=UPI0023D8EDDF|nr:vacuolar protein sorting-associated protein 11 homolog [Zeugodacus cucurbitae]XP_054082836.1 vacuolar protein sorting-associated protein 11 homolog [Zeugodacus cucurbitae]
MIVHEWKSCEFFDFLLLSRCCNVDVQSEIIAHCANGNIYIFCEVLGVIHVCFRNSWTISFRYQCSDVRFCALTTNNEFLVLVADDQTSRKIRVDVLNIAILNKRDGAPCVASAVLNHKGRVTTVRTCLLKDHLLCISIGLDNGNLLIHRSVINQDMTPNFLCISTGKCSILGIEFQHKKDYLYLFVCSEEKVCVYDILGNNISVEQNLEYFSTTVSSCSILHNSENSFFLIGREDALYCFTIDGRGPCYAIGGRKKVIGCLNQNVVMLMESEDNCRNYLIIIDINNRAIVFQKEIPNSNKHIFVTNEISCYIIFGNTIYITKERSLQNKLQVLISSNFYDLALSIIDEEKRNFFGCVLLNFGDYLLSKGDIISATNKYKETIGHIDSYFIIKRLLNSKYSYHLSLYMNDLINIVNASSSQKDLLRSCNTRNNLRYKTITDEICYENEFSKKYFCDLTITTLSDSYEDDLYYEIITNPPMTISKHWKTIFKSIKLTKNPVRYIAPLINTQEICIEFLEYFMTFSNKMVVFGVLLELHLIDWYSERKDISEILIFLQNNFTAYSEQVLITLVNYSFWPGVIYLNDNIKLLQMHLKYSIKCCDSDIPFNLTKTYVMNKNINLQTIEIEKCSSHIAKDHIDRITSKMLNENRQNILLIVQGISVRTNFKVIHLKQLFRKKIYDHKIKSRNEVKVMVNSLRGFIDFLSSFRLRPIEIRKSVCVICKCKLSLPSIYFLCQHAFHLECVEHNSNEKLCPVCLDQKNLINGTTNKSMDQIKWSMPNTIEMLSILFSKNFINNSS